MKKLLLVPVFLLMMVISSQAAAILDHAVQDAALNVIKNAANLTIHIVGSATDPTGATFNWSYVNTNNLGSKVVGTVNAATDRTTPGGRIITIPAVTSISITGAGTQAAYRVCLSNGTDTVYACTGITGAPVNVTNAQVWDTPSWTISVTDP